MRPLFKTEEELKAYLPATAAFKIGGIAPFLMKAQQRHIREALGFEQLDELASAYDAGSLSTAQVALLHEVRGPLASYGYALYMPHSTVQLGATGTTESNTNTTRPASAAKVAQLQESLNDAGDYGIESLLEFLEEHREDYPTWASSDACTVLQRQFIATAKEFDKLVFIDRSRRRFLALQPSVRDVVTLTIKPLLGREMLQELYDQLEAGELTPANKELIGYIKPTLASLAIRDDETRQVLGKAYYDELHQFLYLNAAEYPTFRESNAYKSEVSTVLQQNDDWGGYAAM